MGLKRSTLVLLGALACGCNERRTGTDEAGEESGEVCTESYSSFPMRAVDILVVVDGSEGSQAAQARLAEGLDVLVAMLESAGPIRRCADARSLLERRDGVRELGRRDELRCGVLRRLRYAQRLSGRVRDASARRLRGAGGVARRSAVLHRRAEWRCRCTDGVGDPDDYARSICDPTFVPEFADLGARLLEDLDTTGCIDERPCHDDPECEVFSHPFVGGQETRIEECARGDDGAYLVDPVTGRPAMPGPGVELCWVMQAVDDRDDYCTELGSVASFDVVTIDGRSPALDIHAECSVLSQ